MKIDLPQQRVAAESGPVVRDTSDVNPRALSAHAEAMGELGMAFRKMGDADFRGWMVRAGLQAETMAKDADVKATQELMDLEYHPQTGYMGKKGKNAVDAYGSTMQAAKDIRQRYLDELPNEQSKKLFDQVFVRRLQYSMQTIGSHASRENLNWMKDSSKAREASLVSEGALNWNNLKRFNEVTIPSIVHEVSSRAEMEGWDEVQTRQAIQTAVDSAHVTRLKAMTPYDPKGAIEQLPLVGQQMSAQGRIQAENEILHGVRLAHEQQMWQEHAARRAVQEQDEKIGQDFFSKFVGRELTPQMIDGSNLSTEKKAHWYSMVSQQSRQDDRLENNNPLIVADTLRKIGLPYGNRDKITDINDIYALVGKGISLTAATSLVKMVVDQRTPEGIRLADVRNRAFVNLRPQFVHDTNLGPDIQGAQDFFEFQQAVIQKEEELRREKEDPHSLYDPLSQNYVGKLAEQYKANFRQRLQRQIDALRSFGGADKGAAPARSLPPELMRKQGESITDYLERTRKRGE